MGWLVAFLVRSGGETDLPARIGTCERLRIRTAEWPRSGVCVLRRVCSMSVAQKRPAKCRKAGKVTGPSLPKAVPCFKPRLEITPRRYDRAVGVSMGLSTELAEQTGFGHLVVPAEVARAVSRAKKLQHCHFFVASERLVWFYLRVHNSNRQHNSMLNAIWRRAA